MALTTTQVSQLYVSIFNRASEGDGNTFWATNSTSVADAATQMLATTDAATYFGTSIDTNQAFIEHIYLNTLNKTVADDAAGITYWVNLLNTGTSRGAVVAGLVDAVAQYATSTDATTKAAYDQFTNRVAVSDYTAATVAAAPSDYATSTAFSSGLTVTADAATVTTAKASVDNLAVAGVPSSHTLTTATDVIETTGNDTFTATSATLNAADIIKDNSTTDNDTLNLTLTTVPSNMATITNVENINVNIDAFAGTATTFNATNVTGATITLASTKLGFDGVAGVTAAAANNVTAGSHVTALTVAGLTTGTVNTGAATTASVTGTAGKIGNVVVNGDIALTMGAGETSMTLANTAASTVNLTAGAITTIDAKGAADLTVKINAATVTTITNHMTAGTLTANVAVTAVDASLFAVNSLNVSANITALKTATDANVTLSATQTALTVTGQSATTGNVNITTGVAQTSLTLAALATATINNTAATTIGTLVTGGATTTLNATAATTVSTLTATAKDVVLTGTGAVTVTTSDAANLNASALTGALVYTSTTSADIKGGTAANTVTVGAATVVGYTGQTAVDTIDATALTSGTLAANLGAGNDIVKFGAAITGVVALDGGAGTDTINLATGIDYSGASTWAVTGFEKLTVTDAAAGTVVAQTATVSGSEASSFTSLSITAPATGTSDDTLVLTVKTNTATTDLSGLVVADTAKISTIITDVVGTAETITGTNANDTITAGSADTVTGGAGDDIFVMSSLQAAISKITDFQANAATGNNDALDVTTAVLVANTTTDVSANAIFAGHTGTVNLVVTNGIMTLSGLAADVAKADTLAEMFTLAAVASADTTANVLAFQFQGNTYVYEDSAADAEVMSVELVGLTGVTGLAAATDSSHANIDLVAAANTIVIA